MAAAHRPTLAIVTPYLAAANNGNWHTAAGYARFLRGPYRVTLGADWHGAPDALIALHARRSAAPIARFAAAFPERPLILVLTGTDLYRDIESDAAARRSLDLACRLVVLNDAGCAQLPAGLRHKCKVIVQSARALAPARKPRGLRVAVVGHLREEKNPRLIWRVLDGWPDDQPLRVLHAGRALDPALGREARRRSRADDCYAWLGDQPRGPLRQRVRRCHLLLHPSRIEGGARAVIEAVVAGTPVIASRIDGNVGLLGRRYPGLFEPDDADAARALLLRAAREPAFLDRLARHCARIAPRFAPARERDAWRALVAHCLRARTRAFGAR